ncbi:hypothetical protein C8R46DRAFT_1031459 [Mycena filopes]|nr:hypothetical protein C8R46DRAFT_1031459 [Mycena filopes]
MPKRDLSAALAKKPVGRPRKKAKTTTDTPATAPRTQPTKPIPSTGTTQKADSASGSASTSARVSTSDSDVLPETIEIDSDTSESTCVDHETVDGADFDAATIRMLGRGDKGSGRKKMGGDDGEESDSNDGEDGDKQEEDEEDEQYTDALTISSTSTYLEFTQSIADDGTKFDAAAGTGILGRGDGENGRTQDVDAEAENEQEEQKDATDDEEVVAQSPSIPFTYSPILHFDAFLQKVAVEIHPDRCALPRLGNWAQGYSLDKECTPARPRFQRPILFRARGASAGTRSKGTKKPLQVTIFSLRPKTLPAARSSDLKCYGGPSFPLRARTSSKPAHRVELARAPDSIALKLISGKLMDFASARHSACGSRHVGPELRGGIGRLYVHTLINLFEPKRVRTRRKNSAAEIRLPEVVILISRE